MKKSWRGKEHEVEAGPTPRPTREQQGKEEETARGDQSAAQLAPPSDDEPCDHTHGEEQEEDRLVRCESQMLVAAKRKGKQEQYTGHAPESGDPPHGDSGSRGESLKALDVRRRG